ncbi:DUF2490 domain-containing protein [Hymenobacter sp. 5516J-16]|uniref:DUF2490 domain-containing protein n=1 Tax=Hymenobacter sp. 5516J-16 TaxID=2932253 RepID=UPI001FD40980|nr:DUF2490 domain-containing protein [Hymenobacter sp. 5516J-16]UOQ78940.1 DUF2490 domain-containing protein [Hymenobacter sp. 5516J-16]
MSAFPRFFRLLLAATLCGAGSFLAHGQTNSVPDPRWGSWLIGTVVLPAGPKHWGGYAEVQARSNGLFRQYFYHELKAGISHEVAKNFTFMVAGAATPPPITATWAKARSTWKSASGSR